MIRYRDNMSDEELAALMRECDMWDECYAQIVESDEQNKVTEEEQECFDPIRDGWVGKDGRP